MSVTPSQFFFFHYFFERWVVGDGGFRGQESGLNGWEEAQRTQGAAGTRPWYESRSGKCVYKCFFIFIFEVLHV